MGALDEIQHVVVLMFENQSFDRLLGYLTLDDPGQNLEGLSGNESNPMSPPGDLTPIPVTKLSSASAYVMNFFAHAATANGLLVTPETPSQLASQFWGSPYRMRSIFENLQDRGHDWTVYFDDYSQVFALRNLHARIDRFQKFERFAADVAAGSLPRYSFIEPRSFSALGYPANDQHPPHSLVEGERLLANVYDTLRGEEAVWRRCLLVVLYDEHGGFYDHVPPPRAVPPDDVKATGSGFGFDRVGVRVPALLVSPWVGEGRADHTVYDHTSLLATLKKMLDLPSFLTARDAAANTFEGNFLTDARAVSLTNLSARVPEVTTAPAPGSEKMSTHQRSLLALARVLSAPPTGAGVSGEAVEHAKTLLADVQGA